ncbi:MAG: hypothetical protein N3E37_05240, partial [Candidatus Micrarchaeota archaeon]|nr:hypothetical protein [Candidatus Micrarchaeota archaeon]
MRVTNFVKKPNKSLLENRRSELVNNYCETLKKREMLLSILRNYQTMLERHLEMTNELKKIDSAKESVYRWHIASDKTLSNLNRLKKKYFKLAKINLAMASMCEKIVKFLEPYATKHLMNHSVKFDIQENNTLQKVNPRLLRDAIRRDGIVNNGSISQQFITNDTFNRDAYLDLNMQHICAHPKFSVLYLY